MKKSLIVRMSYLILFGLTFLFIGVHTSAAVEEHHPSGAADKASTATGSAAAGMMDPGANTGMMGSGGGHGMMGPGGGGCPKMMGMMDNGMMPMMMAHMMGGAGGMGKMMGQMGAGAMSGVGSGGMAHMVQMLENLNLTSDQWDQVRNLAAERLEKMADLWAQRMKLQIGLAALRWDKEIDPQQVKDLFVKKAEAKAEMFLTSLDYLRKLKGVLTQEQLKKLEAQGL